jgi:hypothetical protein
MISKKTDIFIYKKADPFEVFPYTRDEKGKITEIYCNYGRIKGSFFNDPVTIIEPTGRVLEESPESPSNNILPYEEGKFLVITIDLFFEKYKDGSIKANLFGVGDSKINWKEKNEITPASFSLEEVEIKSKPINPIFLFLEARNADFCFPVVYEVDLVLYAEEIQYFKGNIDYTIDVFDIGDIREINLEGTIGRCDDPLEYLRELGFIIKDPKYYYHVNFFST